MAHGDDFEDLGEPYDEEEERADAEHEYASRSMGGLIPYRNVPALVGYYLAVFSLLPLFPIGIAALICGIVGLRKAKADPEARGAVHAWIAVIGGGLLGTLWLVLTIGMLSAL